MVLVNNADYFMAIARERSISRAAEQLFLSQSYLSQYLSRMERELDVKLFDRSKIPLEITDAGRAYLHFLERYHQIEQQFKIDLDELDSKCEKTLRLGIGTLRGATLLPDILPTYMDRHPNIRFKISELPVNELYTAVDKQDVDFAIMNTTPSIPVNFFTETLLYERIFLTYNPNHPLAPQIIQAQENHSTLPWDLLRDEFFLLLPSTMPLGKMVNDYLAQNGISLTNTLVINNLYTALNMVNRNLGFCFWGETLTTGMPYLDHLSLFDLKSPDLIFPVSVVYKSSATLSLTARDFIELAKSHYQRELQLQ